MKKRRKEEQVKEKLAELRLQEIKMKYYEKWHATTFQMTQGS